MELFFKLVWMLGYRYGMSVVQSRRIVACVCACTYLPCGSRPDGRRHWKWIQLPELWYWDYRLHRKANKRTRDELLIRGQLRNYSLCIQQIHALCTTKELRLNPLVSNQWRVRVDGLYGWVKQTIWLFSCQKPGTHCLGLHKGLQSWHYPENRSLEIELVEKLATHGWTPTATEQLLRKGRPTLASRLSINRSVELRGLRDTGAIEVGVGRKPLLLSLQPTRLRSLLPRKLQSHFRSQHSIVRMFI